jgi:uncharacterized protein YcaQ
VPQQSFQETISRLRRSLPELGNSRRVTNDLIKSGELRNETVDGLSYLWPENNKSSLQDDSPDVVRFLAPFDPIVWDRRRFEHLWGWAYRFEAYTPVAKRQRGYYAMPLLWRERVIGWANAFFDNNRLRTELGFVDKRPRSANFKQALDEEIANMEMFLHLQ